MDLLQNDYQARGARAGIYFRLREQADCVGDEPGRHRYGPRCELGEHVIICGSALETSSYAAILGDDVADLVFSDPPYNVPINGHVSGLGKVQHREFEQAGMGSLYRSKHDLFQVWRKGRERHRNNVQLGRFGRSCSNVWNYPGANMLSHGAGEGNLLELHPTVKPVALIADAILDSTCCGEIVLDPFLGSGCPR